VETVHQHNFKTESAYTIYDEQNIVCF